MAHSRNQFIARHNKINPSPYPAKEGTVIEPKAPQEAQTVQQAMFLGRIALMSDIAKAGLGRKGYKLLWQGYAAGIADATAVFLEERKRTENIVQFKTASPIIGGRY